MIKEKYLTFLTKSLSYSSLRKIIMRKNSNKEPFIFNGEKLNYFFHSYNNFMLTVRCIEIPIVKYFINKYKCENMLEIGNVLKHYYDDFKEFSKKDTLDKYEIAYDVINMDIKDYKTDKKYDFICSISTFEHMDSDGGRNPSYEPIGENEVFTSYAFKNMDYVIDNFMEEKGVFIVTLPLDYCNAEVDESLRNKEYERFNASSCNIYVMKKLDEVTWEPLDDVSEGLNFSISSESTRVGEDLLCVMEIVK